MEAYMAARYRYISADSHFEVPADPPAERVPARYGERVPRRIKLPAAPEEAQP
jgi:hypothetical protein